MRKQKFPKFIQNTPHGTDKYEGKSAYRVTDAIKSHIDNYNYNENDKIPKIIGLDGEWGSGKSNIIKILRTKLGEGYYIFEYDAWGHQEDLQRRSFLEALTDDLILARQILPIKCSKKNNNGEAETWKEKLKNLLARKRETISKTMPKISSGITAGILLFIFTPISSAIASDTSLCLLSKLLIAFIPIIIALLVWGIYSCVKKKIIWTELFEIYSNEKIKDIVNETISESEPSVKEFTDWMKDLSTDLKKKLIIVFDNMDRLPAEKVKELWSSIHTFFAGYYYPKIWVIIPFDKHHLSNAFGENGGKIELTSHFINKTFPVIYRVPLPVMTDWKKLFSEYFDEAFGETENQNKENIQRIFGIIKLHFTPRDVIAFINELVSLKQTWKDEISLLPIAIFVLKKDHILEKPIESILSGNYLTSIEKFVNNSEEFQSHISALTYGIDVKLSEQIPLKQYLQKSLKGEAGYDINKYSDHRHFISFLDDEINDIDPAMLDKAIISLSKLDSRKINIIKQWNKFVKIHLNQPIVNLNLEDTHKALLLNADEENKVSLIKYICNGFRDIKDLKGDKFFITMNNLTNFVKENKINISISDSIIDKKVAPDVFIEYVNQAEKDYLQYKISCNNEILNAYIVGLIPAKLPKMDFVEFLINDKLYSFDSVKSRIEKAITDNEIDVNNFSEIIKAYKLISKEKPLEIEFTPIQIETLYNTSADKNSEDYYDLIAMGLSKNLIDTPFTEKLDEKIAQRIEYYNDYGSLLILSKDWSSELLRKSVKLLTEKSFGTSRMDITQVLPFFEQIKNAIGVSEVDFLNRLNRWSKYAVEKINVDNIEAIIPDFKFYKYSTETNNELTDHINKIAGSKLESILVDSLYAQRNTPTYYWLNCAALHIQGKTLNALPDNLTEFCKKILPDIADETQPLPEVNSYLDIIINKSNKSKLQPTIKALCDDFCNKTKTITPALFIYFTTNFNFLIKMKTREGDITRNILNIVIKENNCLNLILENSDEYIKIIKKAGDDAEDLKINIRQLLQNNQSVQLKEFATAIGINNNLRENEK